MRISELLARDKITVSCEIFPPKKDGAFGRIFEVASYIQNKHCKPALAHLTCCDSSKEEIQHRLEELKANGIENILALRGDRPENYSGGGSYTYAIDLIRDIKVQGDFCIGAACYPEGHVECEHKEDDIGFLKAKVDAGCDFLTTQMFFDNNIYYNFLYRVLAAGIHVPVIPGIMPVINSKQIKRSCELSGTALPPRFKAIADKFSDVPEAMQQAGIAYATEQIIDLVANGVKYFHIYTMNRPETAAKIMENLSCILR